VPSPIRVVVRGEASMAAHRLWSMGCWSYLHPNKRHCSILNRLQQKDPIFKIVVDVMRPAFNLEPKNRTTILTRDDWTRGLVSHLEVKGLVWYTGWSKMKEGTGAGVYGQPVKRRLFPFGSIYDSFPD
jgi:hypothetical protein